MTHPQICFHSMSFKLESERLLLDKLNLSISKYKIGLVGNNGVGKSTLLKLIAGQLPPSSGTIQVVGKIAFMQQNPSYHPDWSVAQLLDYEEKLNALKSIEEGSTNIDDFSTLNDEWDIKEKFHKVLTIFGLEKLTPNLKLKFLSGGEVTKIFLTKTFSSDADFLLLDEPTNHLDKEARLKLYHLIEKWQGGLIIASHDRTLLNLMEEMIEISSLGVRRFGGNYEAFHTQKEFLSNAKQQQLLAAKQLLAKANRSIQSTKEKHEQRQAKGRNLRKRGDQPKMLLDAMENRSTAQQGSLLIRHNRMLNQAQEKLQLAKEQVEITEAIHAALPKTYVPNGKLILNIDELSFSYPNNAIIDRFNLNIQGAERIALAGPNGSGKTTLIKLILNELQPVNGKIHLGTERVHYLDQNANLLNPTFSILDNFLKLNPDAKENDAYAALARFLFKNISAHKIVKDLSGGEKLRALLACILEASNPPQLLILDEPTNHLDIHSIEGIECALNNYQGALIVISHDQAFLKAIGIERSIYAPFKAT